MPSQAFVDRIAASIAAGGLASKADLHRAKQEAARATGEALPTDTELLPLLPPDLVASHRPALRTKPMRSASGVAVVAVMSSPASCPHGKCIFCPGGPEVDAPQSYTGFEPSTMRAKRFAYESYRIVRSRLAHLERNGHAVDKVEIVIQGGTFPAREMAYQDWFVAGIYAGLNDGPDSAEGAPASHGNHGTRGSDAREGSADSAAGWQSEAEWTALADTERRRRIDGLMQDNETARCRCVGLTIETKPDWCFEEHLDRMLAYGATRVEIGLQTLDDEVLRQTNRGHTLDDSRRAMQAARDAGFKVCVHMMPGLPGNTPESDVGEFRALFDDPDWRPDMLKIYPTLVVMEGETGLKRMWERGEYVPYDSATAARVVGEAKGFVPEWCRIQRIDRDIPTTHIEAGVMNSNLREMAQAWRSAQGLRPCACIRCREAATRARQGVSIDAARLRLVRRNYEASGGLETFLSFEDPVADAVVAFLRLRRISPRAHRPEVADPRGAAFVRELKVYGTAQALGQHDDVALQHTGLGARLLAEAERVAFDEWRVGRVLVIAGVGVKPYYRRHGYEDLGPYVAKLNATSS